MSYWNNLLMDGTLAKVDLVKLVESKEYEKTSEQITSDAEELFKNSRKFGKYLIALGYISKLKEFGNDIAIFNKFIDAFPYSRMTKYRRKKDAYKHFINIDYWIRLSIAHTLIAKKRLGV